METTNVTNFIIQTDGLPIRINRVSGFDKIVVNNLTEHAAANNGHGVRYTWVDGMQNTIAALAGGIVEYRPAADQTLASDTLTIANGFRYIDTSITAPLAPVITVGATNAAQPVITTADTTGLDDGVVVRLSGIAGSPNICGFDFEVDTVNAGVSFRMRTPLANAPGAAGGAGLYRIIPTDDIFYPRHRYIANITQAVNAIIHTTVAHGYTVGQKIRITNGDAAFGMPEINGLEAIVTAVTARTITTDINSTAFTAFSFALFNDDAVSFPCVSPIGIDIITARAAPADELADATRNTAVRQIYLAAGVLSPAGSAGDYLAIEITTRL